MNKNWSVSSLRSEMSRVLEETEVALPGLEADRIICAELAMPRASLMAHPELEIPQGKAYGMLGLASRRAAGEPLAYVLEDAVFCGRHFFVDKRVLIPRTETEILTELAGGLLKRCPEGVFADWCTGSGCVAVTLLAQNQGYMAYAADVSEDALDVARVNADRHDVLGRLSFIRCGRPSEADIEPGSLCMVVANPPYIPSGVLGALETQVKDYEPVMALDGGEDGLGVFRVLLSGLPRLMRPGGALLCETGGGAQVDEIVKMADEASPELSVEKIYRDHRDIERYILWRRTV